jgi:hypothetical protein
MRPSSNSSDRPSSPAATLAPVLLLLTGAGCAAVTTAVSHRDLDVQTRVSDTVFLDPAAAGEQRTLFAEVRNTSDKPDLDIGPAVRAALASRGYHFVDDPGAARYMLQANVLEASRRAKSAAERSYEGSLGSVVTGGALGGVAGYGTGRGLGGNDTALAAGGAHRRRRRGDPGRRLRPQGRLRVVTDVQISERAPAGGRSPRPTRPTSARGAAAGRIQTSSRSAGWKRYRTRVVSTAEQVELAWPDAAPSLVAGLTRSIAGLF